MIHYELQACLKINQKTEEKSVYNLKLFHKISQNKASSLKTIVEWGKLQVLEEAYLMSKTQSQSEEM